MVLNRRVVINERPAGAVTTNTLRIESNEVDLRGSALQQGEILVKTLYVSIDPYLRSTLGNVGDEVRPSPYRFPQFKDTYSVQPLGGLFGGRCAGEVVKSKNPKVAEGDFVAADWKWEEYAIFNPDTEITFEKVDKAVFTTGNEDCKFNLSVVLGGLGVSGSHVYFANRDVLHPKAGETLVVSSGAGCLGQIALLLGKASGAHTVGITSGDKANRLVADKIADAAVDYKAASDVASLSRKLKEVCPKGIDAYFDNTRGYISDAVLENLNPGARVYICGAITTYNNGKPMATFDNLPQVDGVKLTTGMEIGEKYIMGIPHARAELVQVARIGGLKFVEHVVEGFENLPSAFLGMLSGQNYGKMVVKV